MNQRFDVIVVGAGPGGALTALMLAQRGRHVAMIDRERFPRFAIGESSTPIASRAIEQISVDYELPELLPLATWGRWQKEIPNVGGGLKRGFTYIDHQHDYQANDRFNCPNHPLDPTRRLMVAASLSDEVGDTHWVRSDVDAYLINCCRRRGVTVLLQHEIVSILGESPWTIHARYCSDQHDSNEHIAHLKCDHLVDASGRSGALLQHMGYQDSTSQLKTDTSACWSHLVGLPTFELFADRELPYRPESAAVHHLVNDGWVWQLPMADGRTSVGRIFSKNDPSNPNRLSNEVATTLGIQNHVRLSQYFNFGQLSPSPGKWFSARRVQRLWKPHNSNHGLSLKMLPLPTTIATVDPLHSTGLAHAISGAQRVADLIIRYASDEVGRYQRQMHAEVALLDRVVSLAYRTMATRELFYHACMLYFAIAIQDEEDRVEKGFRIDRATWFADQDSVQKVVSEVETLLSKSLDSKSLPSAKSVHLALQRICRVPLACREDNLYDYTFA